MKRLIACVPLLLLSVPVFAAAPTAAQKDEFYRVCMDISENRTLCACKADAAMSLIDERFMGVVIAAMKGGSLAVSESVTYDTYIRRSNQVCKPNY
ncbi:hypothetical protein [Devosia sp. XK-2]|uniref:hypothetical protein n=1 Tax=Devosia sp. XK-2 TaxID=3126689 RepID=UPI0030D50484